MASRLAFVGVFLVAAVIVPPDPGTQVLLGLVISCGPWAWRGVRP